VCPEKYALNLFIIPFWNLIQNESSASLISYPYNTNTLDNVMSITIPESMITCINNMSRSKNCSSNTIVKLAIAKFLFDQSSSEPEVYKNEYRHIQKQSDDPFKEIPLDKIVSVQYPLNDGRVIHITRKSKLC
jgi:hypothetical protein